MNTKYAPYTVSETHGKYFIESVYGSWASMPYDTVEEAVRKARWMNNPERSKREYEDYDHWDDLMMVFIPTRRRVPSLWTRLFGFGY